MRLLKLLRLFKIGKFLNTLRDEFEVNPTAPTLAVAPSLSLALTLALPFEP